MSIVIRESHANNSQPLWVSAAGGAVDGPLTVKDELGIVPSVESGSASLFLGPSPGGFAPYTSLIESTPVDILTSLGSELSFYTRENVLAVPPTLAMTIDSTQDITMTSSLTVPTINGLDQKPGATRFGTYTQASAGTGTTAVANPDIEATSIIYVAPAGNLTNAGAFLFSANPVAGIGFASIANAPLGNAQPMLYYVIKW